MIWYVELITYVHSWLGCSLLCKTVQHLQKEYFSHQQSHYITTGQILHYEVQKVGILKRVEKFYNAMAINFNHQVSFRSNMLNLNSLDLIKNE